MSKQDAKRNYKVTYGGYQIVAKMDFGDGWHLIDGMVCDHGYVVTDGLCNVMPGATWFGTVGEAKNAIDVLKAVGGDAASFWSLMQDLRNHVNKAASDFIQSLHPVAK